MKWSRFHDEPERLAALADILLGAAYADASFSEVEEIEVGARLLKAMGASHLSAELEARIASFDVARFDLKSALARLRVDDMRERSQLIADVAAVIEADSRVEAHERAYLWRLAALLDVPIEEVVSHIGPDWPARSRPSAGPRPTTHLHASPRAPRERP